MIGGRCSSTSAPIFMLRFAHFILPLALLASALGQQSKAAPPSAQRAIKLAQSGHCEQALPILKRALANLGR